MIDKLLKEAYSKIKSKIIYHLDKILSTQIVNALVVNENRERMGETMSALEFVEQSIEKNKQLFCDVSDYIWQHPETRFEEYKSMEKLCEVLEQAGFEVEKGVGGIETAFVGTYGNGGPVIGILGEYDALASLSQKGGVAKKEPIIPGANGHGCGHNLLGTASLAAAFAIKDYLEKHNINGTVKYFGCPGEEGGSGKTYMVREGVFDGVDVALTWHPGYENEVMSYRTLANYQVYFRFEGISSHAAASPHLGRSALDAVELMNMGVNYLREHVIQDARIHYALTNAGGISPNVVQAEAEVLYLIRAPEVKQVDDIYKRIVKIAEGAALMTETKLNIKFDKACSNYIPNRTLGKIMHEKLVEVGPSEFTEEEKQFAKEIWHSLNEEQKNTAIAKFEGVTEIGDESGRYLADFIFDLPETEGLHTVSTDVGDVSWVVPTAQCRTATWTIGTPGHSWQVVSQGTTSIAHKGMLQTGKVLALTAIELLENKELLEEVKKEHEDKFKNNPYQCPIPADVKPTRLKA